MKNLCVFILIIVGLSGCSSQKQTESRSNSKPNIVFFFVDDMGWQDTSVPFYSEVTQLNRQYYTPNMEQLAKEGVKFTQAYATAVCSPSRISVMTGMNAARHKVTTWTLRKNESPEPANHPTLIPPAWNVNGLSAEPTGVEDEGRAVPDQDRSVYAETLPQLLKEGGYKTIHVGKAHFGAENTSGEDPLNLGFDVNIAGHAAGAPATYYAKNNFSKDPQSPGSNIWDVPGLDKHYGTDLFLTEALTIEANEAINDAIEENKPFYLYMSHYAIHAPWQKDDRFYQKYIEAGLSEFDATYASMLEGMDKSLGDIRANLKRLGVDQNTIIVFMSDNGAPKQAAQNLPLRGHKLTPYEGGIRVPMIVKWPGVTQPGSVVKDYLIIEDIFPTFLQMANLDDAAGKSTDGVSFTPLLKSKGDYPVDRPVYWHYPNTYDQPPYSVVRKGDWKLIYHHVDRKLELFNLKDDIGEKTDLSEMNVEKTKELAGILTKHLIATQAQMPTDKITGELVEYPIDVL